jgi:hypothetical protein
MVDILFECDSAPVSAYTVGTRENPAAVAAS